MKSPIGSNVRFNSGRIGSSSQAEANATSGDRVFRHHHTSTPMASTTPASGNRKYCRLMCVTYGVS